MITTPAPLGAPPLPSCGRPTPRPAIHLARWRASRRPAAATRPPPPAAPPAAAPPPPPPAALPGGPNAGTLWGLGVLSLSYLHHSTTGFALPALLPIISEDLSLSDTQGALLTAGYTVLYAAALVPMGLLADRADRPRLLAGGIVLWSGLTALASQARGFGELLACRVGFAAAQATQNPICFSLIPELFPGGRTAAMAFYNSAIYVGRAASFGALLLAGQMGVPPALLTDLQPLGGYTLVPLDRVDLSLVSVLYTRGEYAAVAPIYSYADDADDADAGAAGAGGAGEPRAALERESAFSAWRTLLRWLGPPGVGIAALCLLTVDEPRAPGGFLGDPLASSKFLARAPPLRDEPPPRQPPPPPPPPAPPAPAATTPAAAAPPAPAAEPAPGPGALVRGLVANPAFLALTASAAVNDVGSIALISFQATFYQRVFGMAPDAYAPLLAFVIPVGGIVGGVGAGVAGDWLARAGARGLLTAGATLAAAPLLAASLLAPDYRQSFAALLVGFALSEAWRAPAAVMVREVSPPGAGATASAVHLCIRNLLGGFGPVTVAFLAGRVGLQAAMLLVPACYAVSGLGFAVTEGVVGAQKRAAERAAAAAAAGAAAARQQQQQQQQ